MYSTFWAVLALNLQLNFNNAHELRNLHVPNTTLPSIRVLSSMRTLINLRPCGLSGFSQMGHGGRWL